LACAPVCTAGAPAVLQDSPLAQHAPCGCCGIAAAGSGWAGVLHPLPERATAICMQVQKVCISTQTSRCCEGLVADLVIEGGKLTPGRFARRRRRAAHGWTACCPRRPAAPRARPRTRPSRATWRSSRPRAPAAAGGSGHPGLARPRPAARPSQPRGLLRACWSASIERRGGELERMTIHPASGFPGRGGPEMQGGRGLEMYGGCFAGHAKRGEGMAGLVRGGGVGSRAELACDRLWVGTRT